MKKLLVILVLLNLIGCAGASEADMIIKILKDNPSWSTIKESSIKNILNTSYKWGETYKESKKRLPMLEKPKYMLEKPEYYEHLPFDIYQMETATNDSEIKILASYFYDPDIGLYAVGHTIGFTEKSAEPYFEKIYAYYLSILSRTFGAVYTEEVSKLFEVDQTTLKWLDTEYLRAGIFYTNDNKIINTTWFSPLISEKPELNKF